MERVSVAGVWYLFCGWFIFGGGWLWVLGGMLPGVGLLRCGGLVGGGLLGGGGLLRVVGLFGGLGADEFFEGVGEGLGVAFVLVGFLDFFFGKGGITIGAEAVGHKVGRVGSGAGVDEFFDVGDEVGGEFGVAAFEAGEEEVEHFHGLVGGAAVLQPLYAVGEQVDGLCIFEGEGAEGGSFGHEIGKIVIEEVVTFLGQDRGHVLGGLADLVPIALLRP